MVITGLRGTSLPEFYPLHLSFVTTINTYIVGCTIIGMANEMRVSVRFGYIRLLTAFITGNLEGQKIVPTSSFCS